MRHRLLAAIAIAAIVGNTAARADGKTTAMPQSTEVNASLDQQATSAQLSDPTASHSLRSHGHP